MNEHVKKWILDVMPPILLRGMEGAVEALKRKTAGRGTSSEMGPEWYDATFSRYAHSRKHYSETDHYFFWSIIVDRIIAAGARSILEVGCGTGQMACLMRDRGIARYHGFDFSSKRIAHAQRICPEFNFSVEDVYETKLFDDHDYDTVVCTEVLEHVEGDIALLERIRSGTRFYGSVPNFPWDSHVRYFNHEHEVQSRYRHQFKALRVDTCIANACGKKFYLLDGVKIGDRHPPCQ